MPPQLAKCFLSLLAVTSLATAAPLEFKSSDSKTSLVELYTSEGCSSCPPVDKWLSGLTNSPKLWKEFVPVAFHVDYWNNLGWKDPWSRAEFSDRQRHYARQWRADTIYTPGFVLNGKEWRNKSSPPPSSGTKVGTLRAGSVDGQHWSIEFTPSETTASTLTAYVATLASNLHSNVRAGENSGRELRHDFVALSLEKVVLTKKDGGYRGTFEQPPSNSAGRPALAIWVTGGDNPEPLQAVGGWLQ